MPDTRTTSPADQARPIKKWGAAATAGWQALPDVLLKHQATLGLSATDMLVLINLLSYWWYVEQKPFPGLKTIAKRMNVNVRTVQRSIQKLVEMKLLERQRTPDPKGEEQEALDPKGLVNVLERLAKDPNYDRTKFVEEALGREALPLP